MPVDVKAAVPVDKHDTERAEQVVTLGYPAIAPVLPEILEWVQDINWPVAAVLCPFLARVGAPLATHITTILNSDDNCWKYSVLQGIVGQSPNLAEALKPVLVRLRASPSVDEVNEEVSLLAEEILNRLHL